LDEGNRRVLDLTISDKIKAELPRFLDNFVRGHELENWLEPDKLCILLDGYDVDNNQSRQGSNKFQGENFVRDKNRLSPNMQRGGFNNSFRQNTRPSNVLVSRKTYRCTICHRVGDHLADACPSTSGKYSGGDNGVRRSQGNHESFRSWLDRRNGRHEGNRGRRGGYSNTRSQPCHSCGSTFHTSDRCPRVQDRRDVNRVGLVIQNAHFPNPDTTTPDPETVPKSVVNRVEMLCSNRNPVQLPGSCGDVVPRGVFEQPKENGLSFSVSSITDKSQVSQSVPTVELSCRGRPLSSLVDSGTEISIAHPDMIPTHLIKESSQRGTVKLKAAFGSSIVSDTYLIPLKLKIDISGEICDPNMRETYILCAITDQLSEERLLLSLDDYNVLKSIIVDKSVHELADNSSSIIVEAVKPALVEQESQAGKIFAVTRGNEEKKFLVIKIGYQILLLK